MKISLGQGRSATEVKVKGVPVLSRYHAMKTYGERRYRATHS